MNWQNELCHIVAHSYSLQDCGAIVEAHCPRDATAELRRHACRKRHRLPRIRRIQGGSQGSHGRDFTNQLHHCIRCAVAEFPVTAILAVTVAVPTSRAEVVKLAEPPPNAPVPNAVEPFINVTVSPFGGVTSSGDGHILQ